MDPSVTQEIQIPSEVPVMTLSAAVLFPQAMMPLYIFEPRYRAMLKEVLAHDRIFVVAALDESSETARELETPRAVAGIGMIRACQTNADGSSNLILQGLARVHVEAIVSENPFRRARIRQVFSEPGGSFDLMDAIQPDILSLIQAQINLGAPIPNEVLQFLSRVREPENVLDLAIATVCPQSDFKQELLETRGILPRYERFQSFLKEELERLKLERQLRGDLDDDAISQN